MAPDNTVEREQSEPGCKDASSCLCANDENAKMQKHMAFSPAMPAPTTMTVPSGG